MNYKRIYGQIIKNRLANPLSESEYGQKHHILPKSLYPQYKNTKANLVRLTYREHYICHWLLTKIRPCSQMTNAFWRMNCCQNNLYFNSFAYVKARQNFIKFGYSQQRNRKISEAQRGKKFSEERKRNIGKASKITMSNPEIRKKISQSCKGKCAGDKNGMYGKGKRIWINNGFENHLVKKEEEIPLGYVRGRMKKESINEEE